MVEERRREQSEWRKQREKKSRRQWQPHRARVASNPLRLLRLLLLLVLTGVPAGSAIGEPMQLGDITPRWVSVQFEASPGDRPELLDQSYGPAFRAWLAPAADGTLHVSVDGELLERSLFHDRNPVPGSFSDYVWVFDTRTGAVLSASFSGTLIHELSWGLGTIDVEARVEAWMTTTRPGGFLRPRSVWGQQLHGFCDDRYSSGCSLVSPRELDGRSGYVNAVGFLRIRSRFTDFSTFSGLGEARFSELGESSQVANESPESAADRRARVKRGPAVDAASVSSFSSASFSSPSSTPSSSFPSTGDVAAPPPLH